MEEVGREKERGVRGGGRLHCRRLDGGWRGGGRGGGGMEGGVLRLRWGERVMLSLVLAVVAHTGGMIRMTLMATATTTTTFNKQVGNIMKRNVYT